MNVSRCQRSKLTRAMLLVLGLSQVAVQSLYSRPVVAEDEYTRAIRSEGAKLPPVLPPAPREVPAAETVETPADKRVAEFEALLRAEIPASFRFYQELNGAGRKQVFELYLKEGKLSDAVKRLIVRLRLGN